MRQLMFSRVYPAYHPMKGMETHFIEKMWENSCIALKNQDAGLAIEFLNHMRRGYAPKLHTIRSGFNFKRGDVFAPKVWQGLPYRTKTIQFAEPITVLKTYKFEFRGTYFYLSGKKLSVSVLETIANNDGLTLYDFEKWFSISLTFTGQIICWDKNIDY